MMTYIQRQQNVPEHILTRLPTVQPWSPAAAAAAADR